MSAASSAASRQRLLTTRNICAGLSNGRGTHRCLISQVYNRRAESTKYVHVSVQNSPLAGPVVAAAVVIDRQRFRGELRRVLDDSKVLSRELRESCYGALLACARS